MFDARRALEDSNELEELVLETRFLPADDLGLTGFKRFFLLPMDTLLEYNFTHKYIDT